MTVTEFALLHLSSGSPSDEVIATLEEAQTILDKWTLQKDPELPATRAGRGTGMLRQVEDPSAMLITAQWASPEAHWEWIATEENREAMGKLMPHVVQEGEKRLVLFHVDAEIFTPEDDEPSPLESAVIIASRFVVDTARKPEFEAKAAEIKKALGVYGPAFRSRYGWRIEKESDEVEECVHVLFSGWHGTSIQGLPPKATAGLSSFEGMARGSESKTYKRLL